MSTDLRKAVNDALAEFGDVAREASDAATGTDSSVFPSQSQMSLPLQSTSLSPSSSMRASSSAFSEARKDCRDDRNSA